MNKVPFGAIVGRFQSPYLHEGHVHIIEKVLEQHENLVVFLGVHAGQSSSRNPLDFQTRKVMILEKYPDATVLPLPDQKSDEDWSKELDRRLKEVIGHSGAVLYGSRDSFIPHYHGSFQVEELDSPDKLISATALRDESIRKVKNSQDFRAGVIYGVTKRFPSPYMTVDVAIRRDGKVLLAQKPGEEGWRFIGGFVDNTDANLRAAAKREAHEETGGSMELYDAKYVGDMRVDDWRYRSTKEKIFTNLFEIYSPWGAPEASDDITALKWVPLEELHKVHMEAEHSPLMSLYLDYLNKKA